MIQNSCKNQFYSNNKNQNIRSVLYGLLFSERLEFVDFKLTELLQHRQKEEQYATENSATFLARVDMVNDFSKAQWIAPDTEARGFLVQQL